MFENQEGKTYAEGSCTAKCHTKEKRLQGD